MEYRQLQKLQSTYIDALPKEVNSTTGRVHTTYMQAVTATGRLSSNNPNLQNIPIRTERGQQIRKAFVPRNEDYTLLSADYSQIELRVIAALSGEKNMIEAFLQMLIFNLLQENKEATQKQLILVLFMGFPLLGLVIKQSLVALKVRN